MINTGTATHLVKSKYYSKNCCVGGVLGGIYSLIKTSK